MRKFRLLNVLLIVGLLATSAVLSRHIGALQRPGFDLMRGLAMAFTSTVTLSVIVGLPWNAFSVLVLQRGSPFAVGYLLFGGLFFSTAWTLFDLCPHLLPSAWMAVGAYYRSDQYWPPRPLREDLAFAMREREGIFMVAHLYWTGVFALVGGLLGSCWRGQTTQTEVQSENSVSQNAT